MADDQKNLYIPSRRGNLEDSAIWPLVRGTREVKEYLQWYLHKETGPAPHIVKQRRILSCKKKINAVSLVETGTYLGDMVYAMRNHFSTIVSIELSPQLAARATRRFVGHSHVEILTGDSAELLDCVVSKCPAPVVYWLDGHYSGGITAKGIRETPILSELESIAKQKQRSAIVLIDDARCFSGFDGYPMLSELADTVRRLFVGATIKVKDDIIEFSCDRSR